MIIKVGKFRFYFQNYYTIISLINDILVGALYVTGSIMSIMDGPQWIRQWTYLAGAIFMLMRPILKIIRNIFVYDEKEFKNKVKDIGFGGQKREESSNEDSKKDTDSNYGESKSQEEKMDEIHTHENK